MEGKIEAFMVFIKNNSNLIQALIFFTEGKFLLRMEKLKQKVSRLHEFFLYDISVCVDLNNINSFWKVFYIYG